MAGSQPEPAWTAPALSDSAEKGKFYDRGPSRRIRAILRNGGQSEGGGRAENVHAMYFYWRLAVHAKGTDESRIAQVSPELFSLEANSRLQPRRNSPRVKILDRAIELSHSSERPLRVIAEGESGRGDRFPTQLSPPDD